MTFIPKEKYKSKIVGTTMDQKIEGRPLRQIILEKLDKSHPNRAAGIALQLRREPANKHDPDAISVWAKIATGLHCLGYISNKDRVCLNPSCGEVIPIAYGETAPVRCKLCGGELARKGFASALTEAINDGFSFTCRILQITGGNGTSTKGQGLSFGCNIEILRVNRLEQAA